MSHLIKLGITFQIRPASSNDTFFPELVFAAVVFLKPSCFGSCWRLLAATKGLSPHNPFQQAYVQVNFYKFANWGTPSKAF